MVGSDYSEFHIGCNPPLRPAGVAFFMEELDRLGIVEILYEPQVPAFKVIALRAMQSEVTDRIGLLLTSIIETDTYPLDQPREESGSLIDIGTGTLTIPWSVYYGSQQYQNDFDKYKYPETIRELPFKTIWPVDSDYMESNFLELDFNELLRMAARLGCFSQNPTIESLAIMLGCKVTHNMRRTILYIGTSSSKETIDNALKFLDSLFCLTKQALANIQHVVYTTGYNECFSFRRLSQVGLHRCTFPQIPTDNQKLLGAVSIRTATQDSERWIPDKAKCKPRTMTLGKRSTTSARTIPSCPNPESQKNNDSSRSSPQETPQIEPKSEELHGLDELIIFDVDETSASINQSQPRSIKQNQLASLSLLDENPPANLGSSLLGSTLSEPKPKPLSKKLSHRSRPHAIKLLENYLQSLWSILPRCPGYVTVQVKFGRFYLTDPSDQCVDVGSGPCWEMTELLKGLQATVQAKLGFSTTLSTTSSDADHLTASPWILQGTDTIFQVHYELDEQRFIVDIDAETSTFSWYGLTSELGSTIIHCVHHAWDMKFAVSQSNNWNQSPIHMEIGKEITDSLQMSTTVDGKRLFELTASEEVQGAIAMIQLLHTKRYHCLRAPGGILSVTKFQKLMPSEEKHGYRRWAMPTGHNLKGPNPETWFEANISSTKLSDLLKDNANLSLGEYLSWDTSQQEDICDELFGPVLETIARLDEVGRNNDNGLSGDELSFTNSEGSGEPEVFW